MKRWLLILSCAGVMGACQSGAGSKAVINKDGMKTGANFTNHILVRENGLKVVRAELLKADGSRLPDDNKVGIGEDIYCRLFLTGWHQENGRVKLGASEEIIAEDGGIVTRDEDIFRDLTDASVTDAGVITLTAKITTLHKSMHQFDVVFRVWDKVSNAEVNGTFPFYLK